MQNLLAVFLHFAPVYWLVMIAPGLDFATVLRETLLYGRRNGIMAGVGVCSATIIHCAYTILGIGLIIAESPLLFNAIKWAGIAYLLYIGVKALLAKRSAQTQAQQLQPQTMRPLHKSWMAGAACNLLNPKCVLFFLSIFSLLIPPAAPLQFKTAIVAFMILSSFIWFSCVAFFLTMPKLRQAYQNLGIWIDRITGIVFILLAVGLMFEA